MGIGNGQTGIETASSIGLSILCFWVNGWPLEICLLSNDKFFLSRFHVEVVYKLADELMSVASFFSSFESVGSGGDWETSDTQRHSSPRRHDLNGTELKIASRYCFIINVFLSFFLFLAEGSNFRMDRATLYSRFNRYDCVSIKSFRFFWRFLCLNYFCFVFVTFQIGPINFNSCCGIRQSTT